MKPILAPFITLHHAQIALDKERPKTSVGTLQFLSPELVKDHLTTDDLAHQTSSIDVSIYMHIHAYV